MRAAKPIEKFARKRDFTKTSEPSVRRPRPSGKPIFVVQEHHASHLHYDFRLEIEGVLKSWAVPKGPSLDPRVRRLAVEVEDHPIEYANFAGVIPERQYGAGEVFLWDKGEWKPKGDAVRALGAGKLEFTLSGSKLKGDWILIRTKSRSKTRGGKRNWLLLKRSDAFAKTGAELGVASDRAPLLKSASRKRKLVAKSPPR